MGSSEIKTDLIKHISATKNDDLRKEIKRLLSSEYSEQDIHTLIRDQHQQRNEFLEQNKQDKFLSQDEAEGAIQK